MLYRHPIITYILNKYTLNMYNICSDRVRQSSIVQNKLDIASVAYDDVIFL